MATLVKDQLGFPQSQSLQQSTIVSGPMCPTQLFLYTNVLIINLVFAICRICLHLCNQVKLNLTKQPSCMMQKDPFCDNFILLPKNAQ